MTGFWIATIIIILLLLKPSKLGAPKRKKRQYVEYHREDK